MTDVVARFALQGDQQPAAADLTTALVVTAGAGSGKTRALVARYLNFLLAGAPVRALAAITFTEKAAREMRARIRREVEATPALAPAAADLDSARIGTIHGLCAELLRLYPVEAGVDPLFTVLEEGLAATLRDRALDAALAWAAEDPGAAQLFAFFTERELRTVLETLLANQLDAAARFQAEPRPSWEAALARRLDEVVQAPAWNAALAALAELQARQPDDKMEIARRAVLTAWAEAQTARAARTWDAARTALAALRGATSKAGQKGNWPAGALETAREAMTTLRELYDAGLEPLAAGAWALDEAVAARLLDVRRLLERALAEYQQLKTERRALDFDDLEARAARLLTTSGWAGAGEALRAVLVDEFQDTNERQRLIVTALAGWDTGSAPAGAGAGANLFVVGDAKQSIYRFRGADVTVFRRLQTEIVAGGGRALNLERTFRAHPALLTAIEQLLGPVMGTADNPARPYAVPFAPLQPQRTAPRAGARPPFVEFQLGLGTADAGRQAAAAALAARLRTLQTEEGFAWGEMALLVRASSAFPVYETALEAAGLPYVTVAGRGFYNRPEIRDLLNALTALADPSDDLTVAGLLRSPAVGLTDAELFTLRFAAEGRPQPLWPAFQAQAARWPLAAELERLRQLAGRLSVAELLKGFLDSTGYRAVLGAGRLVRNVDKLLADAHRSGLVAVGDFLEYVRGLRDVGAREGEAPADPSPAGGGAIQLMTVHKAKGLEFPVVVLADAGHRGGSQDRLVQIDPELGVLLNLKSAEARPLAWQLGKQIETDREQAEAQRLLYVALTRAKEKVLINGQARLSADKTAPGRLLLSGWLKDLGGALGLAEQRWPLPPAGPAPVALPAAWAPAVAVTLYPAAAGEAAVVEPPPEPADRPASPALPGPLIQPLTRPEKPALWPDRAWRVTAPAHSEPPARVVGQLVHAALRRWWFPDQLNFEARLRPAALKAGLAEAAEITAALQEAGRLLTRFRAHPLWAEIDGAAERLTEWPYVSAAGNGVIDLLYRGPAGWALVDFKTDDLPDEAAVQQVLAEYARQVRRYIAATTAALGGPPRAGLVFLNAGGAVRVLPITGPG